MAKTLVTAAGIHAVESVLNKSPESIDIIYFKGGRLNARLEKINALARKEKVDIQIVDENTLDYQSEMSRHQGVVAKYRAPKSLGENELMSLLENLDEPAFLLILDGVTDPHNLGACLRSADAAGVHAVIVPRDSAVGITPVVRKSASGAAETMPFVQVTNLARTMEDIKQLGIWVTGTSDTAKLSLHQHDFTGAIAIAMGAEGKGLRQNTIKHCDFLISIPMMGQVGSLNVSVATGVTLYEALRQRQGK